MKTKIEKSSLSSQYPDIAAEWNYEKNTLLTPQMISYGSGKKVWWKCSCGHEWQSTVSNRVLGNDCPYCSNQKVLPGFNDLATTHPNLVKEWDSVKNGNFTPKMFVAGSDIKVWWMCNIGHSWRAKINSRTRGSKCPICQGRSILQGFNDLAFKFPELAKQWNYEKNGDLLPEMISPGSHKKVWWVCEKGHEWQVAVYHRSRGSLCPICSGQRILPGYNDLQTQNPLLALEWNYEKNGILTPDKVAPSSNMKVWWKCTKGHEWEAAVNSRNNSGNGCPICANQVIIAGVNDLKTMNPELAAEWNYEKNGSLTPQMFSIGSRKKVWWKCPKGHEWQVAIASRLGCPICSHKQVLKGYNDLATLNSKVAEEWNYDKNGTLTPEMVTVGSNKYVWWRCKNNHEWRAQVNARTQGIGCAKCSAHLRTSFPEQAIFFYVKKTYPDAISGYRDLFKRQKTVMELDIFIPSIKTAIEYDGIVWHSSEKTMLRERKKYHICKQNEIHLIRIKEKITASSNLTGDVIIASDYSANYRNFGKTLEELRKYIHLTEDIDITRDRSAIVASYMPI